jgi:hypothetical protein
MNQEENLENQSICRLATKKQSLDDMYSVPANFLEIDVINPQTTIVAGKKKFTDYEIRMRVSFHFLFDEIFCCFVVVPRKHPISSRGALLSALPYVTQLTFGLALLNKRSAVR